MEQQTTEPTVESSVTWERLEACLRGRMRQWIQDLFEAEVDELLGRRKSARRKAVDGVRAYRSGHGKPRRHQYGLSLGAAGSGPPSDGPGRSSGRYVVKHRRSFEPARWVEIQKRLKKFSADLRSVTWWTARPL